MARYRGPHRGRHATPDQPGTLQHLVVAARKPAMSATIALTLVGASAGATSISSGSAQLDSIMMGDQLSEGFALSAQLASADTQRLANERAAVNAQRAAATGRAQEVARNRAALVAAARKEAQAKAARAAERTSAIENAKKNPKAAARVMMDDYGWSGDGQFQCLETLWIGESNWNYTAENQSSGAYGIPQSLPASKMGSVAPDYRTNPITQITWGLGYIKDRYGSPCNALSFWRSNSPKWY